MKQIHHYVFAILLILLTLTGPPVFAEATKAGDNEANELLKVTAEAKFSDITNLFWAKNAIMQLAEMGIMTGYRDMQFRPNAEMTVGEAAQAFARALSLEEVPYEPIFSDVEEDSEYQSAVLATYQANIFPGKQDGTFGVNDKLTRIQLEAAIVQAFHLRENEGVNRIIEWPTSQMFKGKEGWLPSMDMSQVGQSLFTGNQTVNRASFAYVLHGELVDNGKIASEKDYQIITSAFSDNFKSEDSDVHLVKVSFDEHPIYLRSTEEINFTDHTRIDNSFSRDNIYTYKVGSKGATIELTVRSFDNGDYFLFSKVDNPTKSALAVDVIQKENDVDSFELFRFDRYPIKRKSTDTFAADTTSYPTGVLRFVKEDGTVSERMVGQSYVSKPLSMSYPNDGYSYMRQLLGEVEAFSYARLGSTLVSIHSLKSQGEDIVDQWYMNADAPLFETDEHRESWMEETSKYYKKRNNWYTASGPYNKMAVTTEPMPETGQGYGRNLLMVKEDRALALYHQQKDRYFENLVYNAFINLKNFKDDNTYWKTEVTSTYLKDLYGITAPFIDTRFNEQIALFYYNSGDEFHVGNTTEPLRNYADLLVSQKSKGNIIPVDGESYYLADYYPIAQEVTTHASMNHVLGGMNILLIAYKEFHDERYLETARAIQTAIAKEKEKWIRDNGDIWYRISPDKDFKGDDYKHLTLEDLINSYKLWQDIDPSYLPLLEEMIASKASYLSNVNLGYTTKIKNGLQDIGLSKYLPRGEEQTDAL
ncbi:S-layer homology domain-containing protein [Sporosarcina sp. FSL W7-1349]|uniref:S-layer homology domain-containing protein n=1 Tax=Sporosarcina sp. FSL W7-1349 TaxID=2921561 RepID=UPI0030F8B948